MTYLTASLENVLNISTLIQAPISQKNLSPLDVSVIKGRNWDRLRRTCDVSLPGRHTFSFKSH